MVILTSSLNLYEKDENGVKKAQKFPNDNGIIDLSANTMRKLFIMSMIGLCVQIAIFQ